LFKSSSDRAFVPFLKRIGFIDQANVPTEAYKDFRIDTTSGFAMAKCIKESYSDLYLSNEFAHKLDKKELTDLVKRIMGISKDDQRLGAIVGTFFTLLELANFEEVPKEIEEERKLEEKIPKEPVKEVRAITPKLGISYTINLNLPATTDIEVFNAIFKSLKEHILSEK